MTTPKFSVSHRRRDGGGAIGAATAPTAHRDEASLREVARRHYDLDESGWTGQAHYDADRPLSADERAGLIDVIARVDRLDPVALATEHDVFLAGIALGSWSRERRSAEMRARHDAAKVIK